MGVIRGENPQAAVGRRATLATIQCKVSEGFFPDELSVRVDVGRETLIAFVSKEDVVVKGQLAQDQYTDGELIVNILRDLDDDVLLVNLPADTLSSGSRVLVSKELVRRVA